MKTKLGTSLVLFALIFMSSCSKDSILEDPSNTMVSEASSLTGMKVKNLSAGITKNKGMLEFSDFAHLEYVVEGLLTELEAHENAFYSKYEHLSVNQIDAIVSKQKFDDYQPLVDFENQLNFSSRRVLIENKMAVWLENPVLDYANNPEYMDSFSPEFRAVMNEQGQIKVGGDVLTLVKGPWPHILTLTDSCWRFNWDIHKATYPNNNSKQYDIDVIAESWPWLAKVATCTRNYKKKNNGNWKLDRVLMSAQTGGNFRTSQCISWGVEGATTGNKKRKTLHVSIRKWGPSTWVKFKDNEISGAININNNEVVDLLHLN